MGFQNSESDRESLFLHALSERMPRQFVPLAALHEKLIAGDQRILAWRISAFPKAARNVDELVEWIDDAPEHLRASYRASFRLLVISIAESASCYWVSRRGARPQEQESDIARPLRKVHAEDELPMQLSESASADVLIPEHELVLVGHDDFGCIAVFPTEVEPENIGWLERHVRRSGLYLHQPLAR
ncbi:MAG: hypothetical protein HYZ17_08630 [Betaproteobacteria bacterium]|nr:hypothetical protein [Betaproteobacteria bacterium]